MPSPLGESENTITVLLRPAQGRGAPIRWESLDGGVGGQGRREEAPALTQSLHTGQLTLVRPQSPPPSSVCLEEDVLWSWAGRMPVATPLGGPGCLAVIVMSSLDSVQPGEVTVQASPEGLPSDTLEQ